MCNKSHLIFGIGLLAVFGMATAEVQYKACQQLNLQIEQLQKEALELQDNIDQQNKQIYMLETILKIKDDLKTATINISKVTTGLRNKNPMNIVAMPKHKPWLGQIGKDSRNHAVFSSYEYGLRAGAITLYKYYKIHKVRTVDDIVAKFSETDHEPYARFLARKLGVKRDQHINILKRLPQIMKAMVQYENGYNMFPDSMYEPYSVIGAIMEEEKA